MPASAVDADTAFSVGAAWTCTGGLKPAAGSSETDATAGASTPEQLPNDAIEEDGTLRGEVRVGAVAGESATIRADAEIARAVSGETRNNEFVWLFAS